MSKSAGLLAVVHLPHSATTIPADLRETLRLSDEELAQELVVMTDSFTDELFAVSSPAVTAIRFPVSRLVVDPERRLDDSLEPMAARGMGVIYERTSGGRRMREPLMPAERQALIDRLYVPHHRALEASIEQVLDESCACLLLDCHSFPSRPLPCDRDQMTDRPDFCLGTRRSNTPEWLAGKARSFLESRRFTVALNRPYTGVLVPTRFIRSSPPVTALMIEVNRSLYMDERSGSKLGTFDDTAETIQDLVHTLVDEALARIS